MGSPLCRPRCWGLEDIVRWACGHILTDDVASETVTHLGWGILSTAWIAVYKVVPGILKSPLVDVVAIASRDADRAAAAAKRLRIPRSYGSYEELLADPSVDVVYIPLPNHMHVPWATKALEAGKHVLVEKPIGLSSEEGRRLASAAAQHPELKVMEAFMYRFHPQWERTRAIVADGGIGELRTIQSFFSFPILDPSNIRNQPDMGGGGLMDLGCYCISLARLLFGAEPLKVVASVEFDPSFGTDRLASAIMEFPTGTATFTCGTQVSAYQSVQVIGTTGRIELELPFNPPQDGPAKLWHQTGRATTTETVFRADQYQLQAEALTRAIVDDEPVPWSLEDSIANMVVIEAILESAASGRWVDVAEASQP